MENQKSNLICSYWIYNYSNFQVYLWCIKNTKQTKQFDTDIPFTLKNKERRVRESTFIPLIDLSLLYRYLNRMASCNYIIKIVTNLHWSFFSPNFAKTCYKMLSKLCWSRLANPVYFQAIWYIGIKSDKPMT